MSAAWTVTYSSYVWNISAAGGTCSQFQSALSALLNATYGGGYSVASCPADLSVAGPCYFQYNGTNYSCQITSSSGVVGVTDQIAALNTQVTGVSTSVTNLSSTVASLQTQFGNLNTSAGAQAAGIATLNGQVSGINTHLAGLDSSIAGINTSLTGHASSIGALSGQIGTLQSNAATTNSTLASLQSTVASLSTSAGSGSSAQTDSPFYLSSVEGGLIGTAILGVWAAAWAFKAAKRAMDMSPE